MSENAAIIRDRLWLRLHGLAAIADGITLILVGREWGLQLKVAVREIEGRTHA